MNLNDRLRANALIEEITSSPKPFFNAVAARELIDLVPVHPLKMRFTAIRNRKSSNSEGFSPGIGNVSIDGDREKEIRTWGGSPVERVGGYKLEHNPGVLSISLLWAETMLDSTGKACSLEYDKRTKEPRALKAVRTLDLLVFYLNKSVEWKQPSYNRHDYE